MGYQALYRAWRPDRFSQVVGQEPITTTLVRQIETGKIAHAYLFCGSRGTGKTSTAKVFARAINCLSPLPGAEPCGVCDACVALARDNSMDVLEIDAASNNGVDEIRALREAVVYPPSVGRYKVYIIDEVHMLSTGAFNALLKTLEEPPPHAVFILATTEPQKLPATILSRCQRFDFKRIPAKLIAGLLKKVAQSVGAEAEDEALQDIARSAEGAMRDALSLLDMCLSFGGGRVTAQLVREALGASDRSFLFDFTGALLQGDGARALILIDQLIRDGRDPAVFSREVVQHLRALMLAQLVGEELADLLEVAAEDAARYREQAGHAPAEALMRLTTLFMDAEANMKWASQPRAVLELSAVRACHPERENDADTLLAERIAKLEAALKDGVVPAPKAAAAKREGDAAPRPAAPAKPAASAPAPAQAVDGPDLAAWKQALSIVERDHKSRYPLVQSAVFQGVDGDVATVMIPKKWKMYAVVLDTPEPKASVEAALSAAFERPIRLRVVVEGAAKPVQTADGKKALAQAFDVFGRENVILTDD